MIGSGPQPEPSLDLAARYEALAEEIEAVVEGEHNLMARMATVAAMLTQAFDQFFWTGFYVVDRERANQLVVGPYQGTLGCLRIEYGRGVCGAAAARRETIVVADIHDYPDHIACDARSRSEIVVPVFDRTGGLIAVLDIDSVSPATFTEVDARGLEGIVRRTFAS
jgi:GAF domain-containing protein